eukprot:jgi/Picre1/29915/NNA_005294.t1
MSSSFSLSHVEDNKEGWGPSSIPEKFTAVPFLPYGKGERLGRIADFGYSSHSRMGHYSGRYREPAPGTSVFNFEKADEDEAFELVDNKPVKKSFGGPQRRPQNQQRWVQQPAHHGGGRGGQHDGGRGGRGWHGGRGRPQWRDQQRERVLSESIDVRPDWQVLGDQILLPALGKMSTKVDEGESLVSVGSLPTYDRAADRVGPKLPAKVKEPSGAHAYPLKIWDDPVMKKMAENDEADVFVSDLILTVIMTAPRSLFPWDIAILKKKNKMYLDRRTGSSLEYITNGETAPDPLVEDKENVNGIENLKAESTHVHQAFREQVLQRKKGHDLGEPLPSELEGAATPSAGYIYKRFDLGNIRLIVRCEIDGCMTVANNLQTVAVHALNEFDPKWSGIDWRTKLDTQRGAVLATELKNNATKIARWTAAALLGGVDIIKLGYISRTSFKSSKAHQLLGTQAVKPKDFAAQMNLNMDNAWGIAKALLTFCFDNTEGSPEGQYIMMRDANKSQLRVYSVPSLESQLAHQDDDDDEVQDTVPVE